VLSSLSNKYDFGPACYVWFLILALRMIICQCAIFLQPWLPWARTPQRWRRCCGRLKRFREVSGQQRGPHDVSSLVRLLSFLIWLVIAEFFSRLVIDVLSFSVFSQCRSHNRFVCILNLYNNKQHLCIVPNTRRGFGSKNMRFQNQGV
jgi:hypothetical protein